MHFLSNVFAVPGCFYSGKEGADIVCSFAELGGVEDYVVMVEV